MGYGEELGNQELQFQFKNPERHIAALTQYGKTLELLGDSPSYTSDEINRFVFRNVSDSLEAELQLMTNCGMLERTDGDTRTSVYGPSYGLKTEYTEADAMLSWDTIKEEYSGRPYDFLENPERGLEKLQNRLSFH